MREASVDSAEVLPVERLRGGGVKVKLPSRYRAVLVARVGADGTVTRSCVAPASPPADPPCPAEDDHEGR